MIYSGVEQLLVHGDLAAAYQQAQRESAKFSKLDDAWSWRFRLISANVLVLQGQSTGVLSLLSEDLPPRLANGDIAIERALLQAIAYAWLGRQEEATRALSHAQSLAGSNPAILGGKVFNARGIVDIERNDLAHAEEMFRKSLEIARAQNDRFQQSSALLNLGFIALQRERYDEALDWSNEAAHTAQSIGAKLFREKSEGNVGWANYQLGNFEEALAQFQRSEQDAESLGVSIDRTRWLNSSGLSLYRLGQLQQAESYYKHALQIAETLKSQQDIIDANEALASLFLQLGQLDLATQYTEQANTLAESSGRIFDEVDISFLKALIAARQKRTAEARQAFINLEKNPALTPSLRWQVENELANIYADTNQFGAADKFYRQSIATFETQRETIKREESKLPFSTNADQIYGNYIHFLIDRKRTDDALRWLDLGRARTLEEGLGVASPNFKAATQKDVDAPAIARRLHGTILVYSLAPQGSYLWAINASGTHFFNLPPENEIDAHVKNYQRAILSSRDPLSDAYVDGMALYRILVEPAASLIPKDSPVFIIPDGSLSTLNFETLLVPGAGIHYWIQDATITNASSLKLLAAFHPEKHAKNPKKLLLIGNPVSPDEKFPDLPNAAAEVADVIKHFSPAEESVFTEKEALPSAYTNSSPGDYSLIHFVAHGTSSSASPLDSAIVLTRNPANPDSFKLYARDVIQHPLHADLVAISACYGSGSRVYGGEGLVGLSWAFLRAGSHYVIGSLWEVSDSAAPQIMDRMYSEIAAGRSPDAALRDAKLSMIQLQNVFRKPLYWATFQLYGGA